jgi:signal transduction histidine kinase
MRAGRGEVGGRMSGQVNGVEGYRALVIDADPDAQRLFKSLLSGGAQGDGAKAIDEGTSLTDFPVFEIEFALEGEKGLELVRKSQEEGRPYTMAFVDMQLGPGWGGIETVSRIWKECFEVQMVICTAHQDTAWHEIIRRFGHSGRLLILTKPFDATEVRQVAYSLAEKWDLARQARSHLDRLQRLVGERTAKLETANVSLQRKIFQNQQAERRLVTQYAVGRIVSEAATLDEVVDGVLRTTGENLGWDWGAMWAWNPEENTLCLTRWWRRQDAEFEAFEAESQEKKFAPGTGLPGQAWNGSEALWVRDIFAESGFERAAAASEAGLHCAVEFPVWAGTRRFGVMEFMSREIQERDVDRMQTLSVIAGAVGQFVERKQAEEDRKRMEVQLRGAQKLESIGQLAAGIAHEINTPTQYIGDNVRFLQTSFTDLRETHEQLEKLLEAAKNDAITKELAEATEARIQRADVDFLKSEIPRAIQQTLEGVERVARIVQAMKDFSHPGTEEKTPVDLNKALETTLTVARNEWKYVAEIKTEFDPNLPLVPCLPGEFNQVLLNLIVNASHTIAEAAGPDGSKRGLITVSTRVCGEWAEIRIRDTGCGIPEHIRHKIFDPFFTTKPVGKGTGQGLAIAHTAIVDRHQGTLTFESEVGAGSVFIIRLPLNPPASPKRASEPTNRNYETSFIRR